MKLGEKQEVFALNIALLIQWAYQQGYTIRLGDVFRDPRVHGFTGERVGYGHPRSYHKLKLAADLNLFKDGEYLTETEDHRPLGDYWKTLHMDNTWGGDFKKKDGNHYSMGEGSNGR